MSSSRFVIVGKNRDLPRFAMCILGEAVDGVAYVHRYPLKDDEELCPDCRGYGEFEDSPIDPSVKPRHVRCDRCEGMGYFTVEAA